MFQKKYHGYIIFILIILIWIFTSPAFAKLTPFKIINDYLIRPNILIIFDTSGSMQYRPDGTSIPYSQADLQGRMGADSSESRMYIAKDVIKNVLNDSRDLANFGLMTFKQTHYGWNSTTRGYFPYQRTTGVILTKT